MLVKKLNTSIASIQIVNGTIMAFIRGTNTTFIANDTIIEISFFKKNAKYSKYTNRTLDGTILRSVQCAACPEFYLHNHIAHLHYKCAKQNRMHFNSNACSTIIRKFHQRQANGRLQTKSPTAIFWRYIRLLTSNF